MAAFIYRCPVAGYNVQGFIADDLTGDDDESFEAITCTICARVHLVNPKTGNVAGEQGPALREVILQ